MDRLSASKLDRAAVCPASFALPCVFEPASVDATKGTEFHATMRAIALWQTTHTATKPDAPAWMWELFDSLTEPPDTVYSERCYAWSPVLAKGRDLGTHDRDYTGIAPDEIGGTADLVVIRGKSATVYDYKTGFLGASIDTAQLAHNALAVATAYGLDEVTVALVIVDLDAETHYIKSKVLDCFALDAEGERVNRIVERVEAAQDAFHADRPLDVTESEDGCRYCPCRQSCPAKAQAISLVLRTEHVALPTAEELLANASPERAAQAWVLAKALEELAGNVRRLVADRAQTERLPLPDGSCLTSVPVEREGIADVDAALSALRPMLGDAVDGAVVTTRKLTKGAVETLAAQQAGKGGGAKAKRAAVDVLRSSGALKTSVHYEVKRKEGLSMAIQDGVYDCKATGKAEYGISSQQTDQIAVEIDVLDGRGESLGKRTVYLSFSDKAATYAIEKLRALGFSGTRLDDLVGLGSTQARCSAKTESDRDGNPRQSWDVFGGSGKAFKTEMSESDKRRLGDRFAKLLGGAAPPPAARREQVSYGPQGTAGRPKDDDLIPF